MGNSSRFFLSLISLVILLVSPSLCQLRIRNIELYSVYNSKTHKTNEFETIEDTGDLVVRRGNTFNLGLEFTQAFNPSKHRIILQFIFGLLPRKEDGSLVLVELRKDENFANRKNAWGANLMNNKGDSLDLQVYVPANVPIGIWKLRFLVLEPNGRRLFELQKKIYMLFNPWNPDDEVYYPEPVGRDDYVLNDVGKIFMGTLKSPEAREWIFGQFKSGVLPAVMFLLDKARLQPQYRSSAMQIAAALSALVNSNDENGVIFGKWTEPYKPFKAPWEWMGSAKILQDYYVSGGRPVRYGQCWVFAAVLTTVCRTLGIPSRTVTNYRSAHDTNNDLRIERYFDEKGETVSNKSRDSIWNFHVWSEAWMSRKDIKNKDYSGWQAIDATPQEQSAGIFRLGPAPVKAVKVGDTLAPYDTPFVYAEVNADLYDFVYDRSKGKFRMSPPRFDYIGSLIITQKPGPLGRDLMDPSNDEIITFNYKAPDNTVADRNSYKNATGALGIEPPEEPLLPRKGENDVLMKSETPDSGFIGEPFTVKLIIKNDGFRTRTVEVNVNITSNHYNGNNSETIKSEKREVVLDPRQSVTVEIIVTPAEYLNKLTEFSMFKIAAVARVNETEQLINSLHEFKLENPKLRMSVEGTPQAKTPFTLQIRFTNPLRKMLTDCKLNIESRNYGPKEVEIRNIGPSEDFTHLEEVLVKRGGKDNFVVNLSCKEMNNVLGKLDILISK